jgi:hypothetical protein
MTLQIRSAQRVAHVLLSLVISAALSVAQESRGTISGTVTDSSGAVVPQAAVTATNVETNVATKVTTNENGVYTLPFLLPGSYRVTASAPGFMTARREDVAVRIADRLQVDFGLQVGTVTDEVRVTAAAPLLQTSTANLGQVIEARLIRELPIPHGAPLTLMYLTPGVVNTYPGGMTFQEPTNLNATSTMVNINGAPLGTTDFTVDGIPNTQSSNADRGVGMANSPPADVVEEFKLETAFDASVGRTSGTVINVSLRSGTNQPHGSAYIFHRNPDWNANTFFANRAGQPKGKFEYDRWGTSLSGPVYIPKIFNGKDRTFFTYGYEGMHRDELQAFTGTVPNPKHLTGDFSDLLALGSQYQIYDPATIKAAANGRFTIEPFAGNIIPANRINPIARNIASYYAAPNNSARPDGVNNYVSQTRPEPEIYYNHVARLDHTLTAKQRIYGRLSVSRKNVGPYRNYWDSPAIANNFVGKTRQATLDHVYMLTPATVLNMRYGYTRYAGGHAPRRLGFDPAELGFPGQFASLAPSQFRMFPRVDISGLTPLATETASLRNNDVHSLFVNATRQFGSHGLKIGTDLRAYRDAWATPGQASGRLIFGTDFTRGPFDNSPESPGGVGQGLASFLLGIPTGGSIDRNDNQAIQTTFYSLYVHDNWRVSPRLTLDLGLRWEYEGPETERFNRAIRGFDATAPQALEAAARAAYARNPDPSLPVDQFRVRGGLMFAGAGGQPRGFWDSSKGFLAPRIGLAYQFARNTVLRSGFGLYPIQIGQPLQNRALQYGYDQATDLVPTLNNGQNFVGTINNPFPTGVINPPGNSLGAATFLGRSFLFYNTEGKNPYTARWSSNIQTMLPAQFLLEVGYVGSKTIRLFVDRDINAIPNRYLSTSPVRDQAAINFLSANVPNPFAGLLPGTGINGANIPRSQLLRPFPQFTGVTMRDFQGYSWYNSLQVRSERRFSRGFTTLIAYTWSKTMEATQYLNADDRFPHRVISPIDRTHSFTMTGIYELPFGRGRALGSGAGGFTNRVIGGWQLGAVWLVNTGEPIGFGNVLFAGNIEDIPLSGSEQNIDRWFNTNAGFVTDAARQLGSNLRTFPLRLSGVRAGTFNSWDLSILKNTAIREGYNLQFRGEFLNAFNHPSAWAPPNTAPTSSAFGRVTGTYSLPRIVQLGLKFVF